MCPFPKLANWWVVEAMIASYNRVYKTVHQAQYFDLGPIGVSDYGSAPIANFQIEFLALDDDPLTVVDAMRNYNTDGRKFILDVFHSKPSAREVKAKYAEYGFEFIRTGPILGFDIPVPVRIEEMIINKVESIEELDRVNSALRPENESIHPETQGDPCIHNLYAEWDGQVVGWVQLITVYPRVGYINQIYTLAGFRKRRIGTALMARAHQEAVNLGNNRMALISSDLAMSLYRRLGYQPMAFFTALRPKEDRSEDLTMPLGSHP